MSKQASAVQHGDMGDAGAADAAGVDMEFAQRARPIPRISIQAFCETSETAEVLQIAAEDRRLSKTHVSIHMGGVEAAVMHYQENPTPNLIVLESAQDGEVLIGQLDQLSEFCDAGTRVVVIGHANDVYLYRELVKRGVSEYLVAPISPLQLMESLSNLYNSPDSKPVGSVIAFVGAKGGVGSSTICHNVAWSISEQLKTNVIIADLDLAFGTTGLDFNQDPVQGIADALATPERLDEVLLDRLLTKCSERLSIFAAPVMLDREYDVTGDACDVVIEVARQHVPFVAVDLPHTWTPWVKSVLLKADEIVITATPDLANLRNAKNIMDLVKANRTHDVPPRLVLNMAGMPKRPEIPIKDFAANLGIDAAQIIKFDCENFGQASNNGQMVEEFSGKAEAVAQFRDLALTLGGRRNVRMEAKPRPQAAAVGGLLQKLKFKR